MKEILRSKKRLILLSIIVFLLWTFIVCYPNPYVFFRNFARYINYPIDASVIELINEDIPDDPIQIERLVKKIVKYEYDWVNYGVPWYMPEPRDAVIRGKGDCESRAMVLASILSAKGIPYSLKASLVHIWVEYPGKKHSSSENEEVSFIGEVNGKYRIRFPDLSQWRHYLDIEKEMLWDVMPAYRKIILLTGWLLVILANCVLVIIGIKRKI